MDETQASIWRCFTTLKDPRRSHRPKKHLLLDIVAIALCAVIAGAKDWDQIADFAAQRHDWLKTFLALPNGIPSSSTLERVFTALSPAALQSCLLRWLHGCAGALGIGQIAIDGKSVRGSAGQALGALHLVSAWATRAKLSLGQVAVADKSNEITAIPLLLRLLDLKGALVTLDAMGCQKKIAADIVAGGGDYVLTVKGNQEGLYDDILQAFVDASEVDFAGYEHDTYEAEERGHGRAEKRRYTVLYDLRGIRQRGEWAGLSVIGLCYSERAVAAKTGEQLRLFIGSRRAGAQVYGEALRGHWGIENDLHWQLDVTFGEDDSRIRDRNAAQNLALLRKWALGLLRRHPDKSSLARKQYKAALTPGYLRAILDS